MSPIQPTIIPRSEHSISRKWISPNALRVLYRLKEQGYLAYLVGGGVRDLLLGREPKDFDIATDARPHEVKKAFRNCRLIGRRFRLAHVHFHNEIIEVATFRSSAAEEPEAVTAVPAPVQAQPPGLTEVPAEETAASPTPATQEGEASGAETRAGAGARPPRLLKTEDGMILRDNIFGTPEEDALRRDFTVNALFYNIADYSVIDYVGGMRDLRNGFIRIIGDPAVRFTEDPVRMVRALRFAAMLGFEIEENTYRALLELKDKVALASPARMYEEVLKLFLLGEGEKTYQLLRKTGLFGVIFPRLNEWLDTENDGFPHTWIGKALEWVDTYVQAGRPVQPHILFGLMFGQYIEEKGRGAEGCRRELPGRRYKSCSGSPVRAGAARYDPQEGRVSDARYVLESAAVRETRRKASEVFPAPSRLRRRIRVPAVHERGHRRAERGPRLVEGIHQGKSGRTRRGKGKTKRRREKSEVQMAQTEKGKRE